VRRSGSWQSVWDDRILEAIDSDEDGVMSVGDLDENNYIRISNSQISDRCKKLAEHGLLRKVGHGVYMITDEGEAYLREEYDVEQSRYINQDQATDETPSMNDSTSENET
jgi:Mn-dependent DtxR family transcriptional regulator